MQIVAALVWPALALVFAGVFAALWRADRVRVHLLGFAAGFFALFLAMTAHIAIPSLDPVLSVPPLHALACLSVIAIIWGAAKRLGQKIPLVATLALSAASSVALYFALLSSELSVALLVQNGTSGLLFAIGAVVLWTARSNDFLDRMLIGTISLLAGFSLVRPLVVLAMQVELKPLIEREVEVQAINVLVLTLLTAMLGGVLIAIAIKEGIEIRHKAARIDPCSGFWDQRTFEQNCNPALAKAHRFEMPATLVALEFDRFDILQEKWGKDTIERIVREISDVVRSWQRESDIVGRIGEHRLGILLIGVAAPSARSIVQSLRKEVDLRLNDDMIHDLKVTLTASITQSVAVLDMATLLRSALQPLGSTKQLGPSLTFVNGVQAQLTPLARPGDDTFVALG